jgi:hypothetical protein
LSFAAKVQKKKKEEKKKKKKEKKSDQRGIEPAWPEPTRA